MKNVALFLGCLVTLCIQHSLLAQTTQYAPKPGEPHPDFILPTIEGDKSLQLSEFRGKKVLLMHFASW